MISSIGSTPSMMQGLKDKSSLISTQQSLQDTQAQDQQIQQKQMQMRLEENQQTQNDLNSQQQEIQMQVAQMTGVGGMLNLMA